MKRLQGLKLPVKIETASQPERCEARAEHVRQSLRMILSTRQGTRPLLPEFGCRIHELLFRPATRACLAQMEFFIEQALRRWEPRIELSGVSVRPSQTHEGVTGGGGKGGVNVGSLGTSGGIGPSSLLSQTFGLPEQSPYFSNRSSRAASFDALRGGRGLSKPGREERRLAKSPKLMAQNLFFFEVMPRLTQPLAPLKNPTGVQNSVLHSIFE